MNTIETVYNSWIIFSGKIALYFIFIAIIYGILNKRFRNVALNYLFFHLVINASILVLMNIFTWITTEYKVFCIPIVIYLHIDSTNFFSIFAFASALLILSAYYYSAFREEKYQKLIKYSSWLLFIIVTIDYFFFTGYNNYSSFSQTLLAVYGFVMPSIHLWYIYQEDSKVALNKNPYFWISLGLLLPNIMTVWLELFGSRLYEEDFVLFCQVSIANSVFYCLGMLLIARGFYFARYVKYLPN